MEKKSPSRQEFCHGAMILIGIVLLLVLLFMPGCAPNRPWIRDTHIQTTD